MTTTKPWIFWNLRKGKISKNWRISTLTGDHIATIQNNGNSLDNARLIAAAPDLLEALQWIADHGDTGEGGRPAFHDMRAHARAAIAKATGEPQK